MTIDVKDANNSIRTLQEPNANGRAAAAASRPVALSTEDLAAINAIATALAAALPLPTGAATQTTLAAVLAALQGAIPAGAALIGAVASPAPVTLTVGINRPADTTAYAVGDAYADSASTPAVGGFLFTGAARAAGKSVILSDFIVTNSNPAATPLQGELWIFDTAVTAQNDNAAFGISDTEVLTLVAKVPFFMSTGTNNNSTHVQGINALITTVGSANLRCLVRVTNAYTPASGEALTFRAKFLPVD